MRNSVLTDFSEWVLHNQIVFTSPYDRAGLGRFFPRYTNNHPMPENQKSQFVYLRPDLGTKIFKFTELGKIEKELGIKLPHHNKSSGTLYSGLTEEATEYVRRVFKWDFEIMLEKETEK